MSQISSLRLCMEKSGMENCSLRDILRTKAVLFSAYAMPIKYKVAWYLWSADIWFGNFPLLKFVVGCNILVWLLLFAIK